jgi:hypothetical protein
VKERRYATKRDRKVLGLPKDEPWVWQTTELLNSAAWRAMGTNTGKLIDCLLIEHSNHAGRENGRLIATHNQLAEYGLTPCHIAAAIDEAEFLGLIRVVRGGRRNLTNQPSTFRLTWIGDRDFASATNEWKGITEVNIDSWKAERVNQREARRKWKLEKTSGNSGTRPLNVSV